MTISAVYFIFRVTIGVVCLWAGLSKVDDLPLFVQGIANYKLIPQRFVGIVGKIIILAEISIGLLLITDIASVAAFVGALILFTSFAAALSINLFRKNKISCSCFGANESEPISIITL